MKMKNLKKRISVTLSAICFCMSIQFPVNAAELVETQEISYGAELLEEMMEEDSLSYGYELSEEEMMDFEEYSNLCYYFMEKADDGEMYPEYISGVYCEEEGLIVATTADIHQVQEEIIQETGIEDFIIKSVEYTYKELNYVKEDINNICLELNNNDNVDEKTNKLLQRINSIIVDEKENAVMVGIDKYTIEDELLFRNNIYNSDKVKLYDGSTEVCSTILQPGGRVYSFFGVDKEGKDKLYGYSIGCRAYRINESGVYEFGFITAAHYNTVGSKFYITNDTSDEYYIGKVTKRSFVSNIDAAFVCVDVANYKLSNKLVETETLKSGGYISDNYVGAPCIFLGATTGRFLVGKVTDVIDVDTYDTNNPKYLRVKEQVPTFSTGGVNIYNIIKLQDFLMVTTIGSPKSGDSGGLLYTVKNGEYYVLGFLSTVANGYSYHTKYANVLNKDNIYIY